MHSSGSARHGHPVPGEIWHGQDSGLCVGHLATDGTHREPSLCPSHVPHKGAGFPNQQGIRTIFKVHAPHQGEESSVNKVVFKM